MRHSRDDYDRIQDPAGRIPEDEPVFLLRGQDKYAARIVRFYADCVNADGGDPEIVRGSLEQADLMDAWDVHKAPDIQEKTPGAIRVLVGCQNDDCLANGTPPELFGIEQSLVRIDALLRQLVECDQ